MNHMTSVTRETLLSLTAVLLLSAFPVYSAQAQMAYCDPKLGRDFDQQSDEVRMARMNLYFDCRLTQDFRVLQTSQQHMLTGIQRWQSRGSLVARTTLRTKRHIFDAELKTIHLGQRNDRAADFSNQFAELEASRTSENRTDIDSQWRELTSTKRAATADQSSRQRQEVSLLRETMNQCSFAVNNEIKLLMSEDSKRVREQFLWKSTGLRGEYQTVKKVPMNQSLNQYLASLPIDEGAIGTITDTGDSVTIKRSSGEQVDGTLGLPIYPGDVIETGSDSDCTIIFIDQSSTTIGSDSRVTMDEYVYEEEPAEPRSFPILRGVFLFTSGLIGRREVSGVDIKTEAFGVIGIRG